MATQTITVQVDQGMADVVRALMAKIEASGKSTADFLAQMEASQQALVVEIDNGQIKITEDAEQAETRKAIRRALDDMDAGRVKPFDEFAREMRQRFPFLSALPERK
jgi:hypothetical protein